LCAFNAHTSRSKTLYCLSLLVLLSVPDFKLAY
jgi:hypothetical protein